MYYASVWEMNYVHKKQVFWLSHLCITVISASLFSKLTPQLLQDWKQVSG